MKEIKVQANIGNLSQVLSFVEELLEACDAMPKAMIQTQIAVEEIFVNIANYAYGKDSGDALIRADFDENSRKLFLTFIDKGIPFNPLNAPVPDVTLSLSEREAGGLGIYMTRKYMDDMQYEYKDGCNILTLTKQL